MDKLLRASTHYNEKDGIRYEKNNSTIGNNAYI
ncbi:MAG: hypothetical protein BWY74_01851 [Firmicutes bacterium ADurb.Bin419]|nr:MAG: hypothetical protein BWY74_01851 [Firmicutes bacterium ADurb.Bin419]